jgi:hypothetical protein
MSLILGVLFLCGSEQTLLPKTIAHYAIERRAVERNTTRLNVHGFAVERSS